MAEGLMMDFARRASVHVSGFLEDLREEDCRRLLYLARIEWGQRVLCTRSEETSLIRNSSGCQFYFILILTEE